MDTYMNKTMASIASLEKIEIIRSQEFIVRRNLTMHRLVTPFVIRQPTQRPRLLERVYKPMRTLH